MLQYLRNILITIDQALNVVFFLGDPDETVSSHIGRVKLANGRKVPKRRFVMWALDWVLGKLDKNHSIKYIEHDEGREGLIDKPKR
jgi:hypothetical protein